MRPTGHRRLPHQNPPRRAEKPHDDKTTYQDLGLGRAAMKEKCEGRVPPSADSVARRQCAGIDLATGNVAKPSCTSTEATKAKTLNTINMGQILLVLYDAGKPIFSIARAGLLCLGAIHGH